MLRRDRQIRILIQQLTDACLVAASFWIAYVLRASLYVTNWLGLAPPPPHILTDAGTVLLAVVLIPITPLILESQGFYEHPISGSRAAILWPLVKGCMITVIGLALVAYAFHMPVPRAVPTFYGLISLALLYAKVECRRLMAKGRLHITPHKRRLLLAGTKNELARMCRELEGRRDDAVAIIAQFDLAHPLAQFVQAIHDHSVSGVILSARHTYFEQIENIIKACELEGVEVWLMADFFNTQISHTTSDELFGHPLLIFSSTPQLSWQSMFKQALDFFGAVFLLIVSSPVFAVVSIIIKATSPGPIFFRQKRSGLNGTPFHLYKFRTMVTNAEQFKQELEAMNEMNGPVFKLTNDPRVTGVGKWLRRYSLDELPQLWNVLRGEMSLVGPRPLPVDEVKRFNDFAHRRRLSVRPGLTCLWQVSGRNQITDFKEWVRLDLEYIDNWSLWLDLKILFRTIPAVFTATGAK